MPELLLELLSEEIPSRMQAQAVDQLTQALDRLVREEHRLAVGRVRGFVTPRRLCVVAEDVAPTQADQRVERRGPRIDAPEAARAGFLRGLGTEDYELREAPDRKGAHLVAEFTVRGRQTAAILAAALPGVLAGFSWPSSMRWGAGADTWVRPLRGILCLFGGEVVPFAFAGLTSGDTTSGHRFMAPAPLRVLDFADYAGKLRQARVMLDPAERQAVIRDGAERLAHELGFALADDPGLLAEVAGLVEWPVPLLGRIDAAFMKIPPEVLVTTMRVNQKYLTLRDAAGRLAPAFVTVANLEAADGGRAIVAGNERVLRARLWDARFFWDQDRQRSLEAGLPRLERMIFHAELGTMAAKVERMIVLAGWLAALVPRAERAPAERAAMLAKADLVSGMVGEFPELQGIMGGYYARHQGEDEAVAAAIAEHYAPRGPDDRCPTQPLSVVVGLADKLDALVGFFARGIKPTGSRDPFALRRGAIGIIRLTLENGIRLPLRQAFATALDGLGEHAAGVDREALATELLTFLADRLKVHLREEGVRHDLVGAVFAAHEDDDLVRLVARVRALAATVETAEGANLLAGVKRAANILAIEEKRDGMRYEADASGTRLVEPAEHELASAVAEAGGKVEEALHAEAFDRAMLEVAGLRPRIDAFFDSVMVNVDEPELRAARLRLLAAVPAAVLPIADFRLIEDRAT